MKCKVCKLIPYTSNPYSKGMSAEPSDSVCDSCIGRGMDEKKPIQEKENI